MYSFAKENHEHKTVCICIYIYSCTFTANQNMDTKSNLYGWKVKNRYKILIPNKDNY